MGRHLGGSAFWFAMMSASASAEPAEVTTDPPTAATATMTPFGCPLPVPVQ